MQKCGAAVPPGAPHFCIHPIDHRLSLSRGLYCSDQVGKCVYPLPVQCKLSAPLNVRSGVPEVRETWIQQLDVFRESTKMLVTVTVIQNPFQRLPCQPRHPCVVLVRCIDLVGGGRNLMFDDIVSRNRKDENLKCSLGCDHTSWSP